MNKAKIIEVMRAEEQGFCSGVLAQKQDDLSARYMGCALGCLLFAAGMSPQDLLVCDGGLDIPERWHCNCGAIDDWECECGDDGYGTYDEDPETVEYKAVQLLDEVYGLDRAQFSKIIGANDQFSDRNEDPIERRDRVIKFIEEQL